MKLILLSFLILLSSCNQLPYKEPIYEYNCRGLKGGKIIINTGNEKVIYHNVYCPELDNTITHSYKE